MINFNIDSKRTALLVHDMQSAFLDPASRFASGEAREVLPNIERLIDNCRNNQVQIVYTRVLMRPDLLDWALVKDMLPSDALLDAFSESSNMSEIWPSIAPQEGDIVIRKNAYSPFYNTNLEGLMRGLELDTLAITGVTTNVGCDSTARDALYRGIKVAFFTDAAGAHSLPDVGFGEIPGDVVHKVSCSIIGNYIGRLVTTDEFISEINQVIF